MHVDTDSHKLKVDKKFIGLTWSKNGCGQSGHKTLKLTVSQKWTDGINWFFGSWYKLKKAKSWLNDFKGGHGQELQWSFSSWDPKICCILRMNSWIELILPMLTVMQ